MPRRLVARVNVRFFDEDAEDVKEAARRSGNTLSAWLRATAVKTAREELAFIDRRQARRSAATR